MKKKEKEEKRLKRKAKFSNKKHPSRAIIAVILAISSIIAVGIAIGISAAKQGKGELILGGIGIIALFLCLIGFILAIKTFHKKDIYYMFPIVGTVLNGIFFVLFLLLYISGI